METQIAESLEYFPVVAITGPRQCGKSTLAKELLAQRTKSSTNANQGQSLYLDLERPSDTTRLSDPELFLGMQKGKTICIDEIQRMPNLFPLLRSLVDEWQAPGSFLILGSASRDLLKQSSETLAGRIAYHRLMPFLWSEIKGQTNLADYLVRGAFPKSILAQKPSQSLSWLSNFTSTFLERDLLAWIGASPTSMRRLWTMLAHENGATVNYSRLGSALGVSDKTVRNHIDVLASTYMLDLVPPHHSNLGKRLIRAPKVYLTDTGLTTSLLGLRSTEDMLGHPGFGALWEQAVLMNLRGLYPDAEITHYRTAGGAEMDFVVNVNSNIFAVECKASAAPKLSAGTHNAIEDIKPKHTFVVAQVSQPYPHSEGIDVIRIDDLAEMASLKF
ncbi:MAG: ATP-binding protein [Coriobacteriaceae bacterium]|nr:ATP-binding protein [Coriobacteriaceae bacterium]